MSIYTIRATLTQTCDVERDANAAAGGWGDEQTPDWQTHLTGLPCRAWTSAARSQVDGQDSVVVTADMRMIVELDTDVAAGDRIASISERGSEVIPGPLQVQTVMRHADHVELSLVQLA